MQTFERHFGEALRRLLVAERSTALLLRCQPTNAKEEQARLVTLLQRGCYEPPRFVYRPVPDQRGLRTELERLALALGSSEPIAALYRERIDELALESAVVEAVGTPAFRELAIRRYASRDTSSTAAANQTAKLWVTLEPENLSSPLIQSDDAIHPDSLLSRLWQRLDRSELPFRVELRAMAAAAATGDRVIYVAPDRWLSPVESARIVEHEVVGHALPRDRASREGLALFAVGSARGSDEQEGYALYCERKAGLLDARRKRELGRRHLVASGVHEGADFVESVRLLQGLGAAPDEAIAVASRVHRGGGLAREIVYLPAFVRVEAAASLDPESLTWLGRGRLSLDAIGSVRRAERHGAVPTRGREPASGSGRGTSQASSND